MRYIFYIFPLILSTLLVCVFKKTTLLETSMLFNLLLVCLGIIFTVRSFIIPQLLIKLKEDIKSHPHITEASQRKPINELDGYFHTSIIMTIAIIASVVILNPLYTDYKIKYIDKLLIAISYYGIFMNLICFGITSKILSNLFSNYKQKE